MKLNPDQLNVVERIKEHAAETAPDPIVVIGPGGSGKTTCVMEAVREVLDRNGSVLLCAPTHKAVEVMVETAKAAGLLNRPGLGFSTLHAALGLALLPTDEHRQVKKMGDGILHNYDLIVVDECSMLGRFVVETILHSEILMYGHRIVFMGDEKQVFPVRESESPVFSLYEVLALKRVERFSAESGIATITNHLRDSILRNSPFSFPIPESSDSLKALRERFFKDEVVEVFSDHNVNPLTDARVIAWRNRTVDMYNKRIRSGRYGKDAAPFVVGEVVLAGSSIGSKEAVFAHVDAPLTVVEYQPDVPYQWHPQLPDDTYLVDKVTVEALDGSRRILNVVTDSGSSEYQREVNRRRRIAIEDRNYWPDFYRFVEAFDDLRYPYCTTVHKAQGSTYDRVYVDVSDIASNNKRAERLRLLYVACSRPRHQLIVNTPNIRA